MTGNDDPTISCTHLMVKLSVLAGRKKILKGVVKTPFNRRGLNQNYFYLPMQLYSKLNKVELEYYKVYGEIHCS